MLSFELAICNDVPTLQAQEVALTESQYRRALLVQLSESAQPLFLIAVTESSECSDAFNDCSLQMTGLMLYLQSRELSVALILIVRTLVVDE